MVGSLIAGCLENNKKVDKAKNDYADAVIVGSTQVPDPVLEKVMALERQGLVKNVVVMESFPVQIKLSAPISVVKELEEMSGNN